MQTLNRKLSLRRSLLCSAAALAVAGFAPLAQAQQYPNKPITMVVPYPPGGSNDSFARQIAKELGDVLKQSVIVENRPGASGNTGTGQVAKAQADGYTLLLSPSSA
ncbi:MAG: tripartite tricarboxylate transporter substrate-binding protein, partial [Comamonas sp.]